MKDLTQGKPTPVITRLSIPLLISVLFQQMYNMADSIIAGKFVGEDALSAIGASYAITMLFMSVAFGCNIGSAVVVSRYFGEKNFEKTKSAISTTLITSFIISLILLIGGKISSSLLLRLTNTPDNIFDDSKLYFDIFIYGMPFLFIYNVVNGIFTSMGDSKTPQFFLICSSVGNIILDYVFVRYCGWGVAGVAWATFIAQGIACILAVLRLYYVLKKIKTKKFNYFSLKMLGNITYMSVPSILQQSFVSVGNVLIQGIINDYGSSVIAGYSAGMKINMFGVTCLVNVGSALSAYTSQNYGAKSYNRIKEGFKSGMKIILATAIPFLLLEVIFSEQLITFFCKEPSAQAIDTGKQLIMIICPFYIVISVKFVCDSILRGIGNMKLFMITTFTDLILRVLLSFILNSLFGVVGVFVSWPVGWIFGSIVSYCFWIKVKKTTLSVT